MASETTNAAWLQIVLKLLEWPFPAAVFLVIILFIFRTQLAEALKKGGLVLKIQDLEVRLLKQVEEKIQANTYPIRDKVDAIDQEQQPVATSMPQKASLSPSALLTIIKRALSDPRYTWRSVERLAKIAGVEQMDVLTAIASEEGSDIQLGTKERLVVTIPRQTCFGRTNRKTETRAWLGSNVT